LAVKGQVLGATVMPPATATATARDTPASRSRARRSRPSRSKRAVPTVLPTCARSSRPAWNCCSAICLN